MSQKNVLLISRVVFLFSSNIFQTTEVSRETSYIGRQISSSDMHFLHKLCKIIKRQYDSICDFRKIARDEVQTLKQELLELPTETNKAAIEREESQAAA